MLGFGIVVSIVVLPNVLFNLYVMAFGFEDNALLTFLQISEILFFLEIVQKFFTSYSDPEHYDVIDSLKLIAKRYVFHDSFFLHVLAFFPWWFILPNETEEEQQLQRNLLIFKMLRISRIGTNNFIPEE